MITMTEGKLGEGMSYKQMFVGQFRIGGSRRFFMIGEEYWLSEHVANFSLALLHLRKWSLTPAQAQRVLNAVLDFDFETFCPDCQKESFRVLVGDSGELFDDYSNQAGSWLTGKGRCISCGFLGPYSESSL